jgi:hypothetical protein
VFDVNLLRHKTVRFLLAVAVVLGGYAAYGRLTAPWRMAPALQAELARGGYADIAVRLPFKPEQFHINLFQQVGTVRGVRGDVVLVGRVPAADVERLARYYWIRRIEPLTSPTG